MPLRNTTALRDWAQADAPSDVDWNYIYAWLQVLERKSWAAPSRPDDDLPHLTDRPNYEARRADISLGVGVVRVTYQVTYSSPEAEGDDIVDLLKIASLE